MRRYSEFDLTYLTIDSISEGVGSSQIVPLITRLSKAGMKINLISFEKTEPSSDRLEYFKSIGVEWNHQFFGSNGLLGGVERLNRLRREVPRTKIIHARSDIPAVSGLISNRAPVLWDVRSLWADQKVVIQKSAFHKSFYGFYRGLESLAANKSRAMSTLTSAVVPILEQRHSKIPALRTVVPTAVDLNNFKLNRAMPKKMRCLFSGTFNDYYDLELSALFMDQLRKFTTVETHWAKPLESNKSFLGVGEEKIFVADQFGMPELIPMYSFGVSICKVDSGPSLAAAMPTKIAEFLASGRPVVVNKGLGDMDEFIEEFDAGIILDGTPNSTLQGANKLISLVSDPQTPGRCRALAEKYFSMDIGARKYMNLYSEMLNIKG
jgi:hypothetical protein